MRTSQLIGLTTFLLATINLGLVWATADTTSDVARERENCQRAMREDEARDEPKLTEEYKARCRALSLESVPLQPLHSAQSNQTEQPETTEAETNTTEAATSRADDRESTRIGGLAEDAAYPDETRRGMGAVGTGADYRRGYLDHASGNLREEHYENENYLAGASAQANDARRAQLQADASYPDETQRGMGATGAAADYRRGYLDHANGTLREELYDNENYMAGASAQRNEREALLRNNPNPIMDEYGNYYDTNGNRVAGPEPLAQPAIATDTDLATRAITAEEEQNALIRPEAQNTSLSRQEIVSAQTGVNL
ncbi:MAG: hypothetical protein INF43_01390, partial [Alphaproteobacteria bacterium]|nr:hypothetical protein [Alphaproteobacteria bacterium]